MPNNNITTIDLTTIGPNVELELVVKDSDCDSDSISIILNQIDFKDSEAYIASAKRAAVIGIEGKWAIHPSQIELANNVFSPPDKEVRKAKKIIEELTKAAKEGKGAAQLDGRMIDAASARMAENIVNINSFIQNK